MRGLMIRWMVLTALLMGLWGCAKQSVVVLVPDPDGSVGAVTVKNEGGSRELREAGEAAFYQDRRTEPQAPVKMEQAEIDRRFARALAAQPSPPQRFLLYFQTGSSMLLDESRPVVEEIVRAVGERKSVDISVVGHSDTVGDDKYNIKLSTQRAQAVADLLIRRGVDPASLEITSHGKRRPLVPTGDNVHEPRNRRVEVTVR